MKTLSSIVTTSLFILCSHAVAKPNFLSLEASAQSYSQGQAAVLTAKVLIQPTNPEMEVYLNSSFRGSDLKLTRISEDTAVAVTSSLNDTGDFEWSVRAYLQNAKLARSLDGAIAFYQEENLRIERALQVETDATVRSQLEAERNRNNETINKSRDNLWANRRSLGEAKLNVHVVPATPFVSSANPVISIEPSRENASYAVGEKATFFVHALTDFYGPDGIQEVVANGWINGEGSQPGIEVTRKRLGAKDFSFLSKEFVAADEGYRTFSASLQIRSKAQADSVRGAITKAAQMRAKYIAQKNATDDLVKKIYYQRQINDLNLSINELTRQLSAMLTNVGDSRSLPFRITAQ